MADMISPDRRMKVQIYVEDAEEKNGKEEEWMNQLKLFYVRIREIRIRAMTRET
jgi:hypothetical protein